MKPTRRNILKQLLTGLITTVALPRTVAALPGPDDKVIPMTDAERRQQKDRAEMKQAEQSEARKVEELYSTKPKRVFMGRREYLIPANYFGPKERNEPDTFHANNERGFGFFL